VELRPTGQPTDYSKAPLEHLDILKARSVDSQFDKPRMLWDVCNIHMDAARVEEVAAEHLVEA